MKTYRIRAAAWMVAVAIGLGAGTSLLAAQATPPAAAPTPAPAPAERNPSAPAPSSTPSRADPERQLREGPAQDRRSSTPTTNDDVDRELLDRQTQERRSFRSRPEILRIGQDHVVRVGDTVNDVVVISGALTIEGHVEGDVVVVLGRATIATGAVVDGDVVVVGGNVTVAPGAVVAQDLVVVGGALETTGDFAPGGEQVIIGGRLLGHDLAGLVPWVTRGLLLGRPLVPGLPWMWTLVGVIFVIYLAASLLLPGPVRASADTLAKKPLSAFFSGLLVLLLIGPVSFILMISVVGIPVVPFLFCALFVAGVLGKIGVARWLGERILVSDPDVRWHATRAFILGFAIITVAYMIPVLGFAAWALLGVLGLGAASLAFLAALRRENPAAPRRPVPPIPPPPPPARSLAPEPQPSGPYDAPAPAAMHGSFEAPSAPAFPSGSVSGVPAGFTDLRSFPHAPFLDRAAAFALDVVLVLIAFQILGLGRRDDYYFAWLLAYHIGFWTWRGTTVGGIICQLRVVRTDGSPLQFADSLVRGLSSILSLAVAGLGGLWILRDPERQSWHDKIAGTYVVKVPRHWPLG